MSFTLTATLNGNAVSVSYTSTYTISGDIVLIRLTNGSAQSVLTSAFTGIYTDSTVQPGNTYSYYTTFSYTTTTSQQVQTGTTPVQTQSGTEPYQMGVEQYISGYQQQQTGTQTVVVGQDTRPIFDDEGNEIGTETYDITEEQPIYSSVPIISTRPVYGTRPTYTTTYVPVYTTQYTTTTTATSSATQTVVYAAGPVSSVPCFLGSAQVLTTTGYRRIDSIEEGDQVYTGDKRIVSVIRIKIHEVIASPAVNPYIIPGGKFGATCDVLVSPNHKIFVEKAGMIEARSLGLQQKEKHGILKYYNLELPTWATDTFIVSGVIVESLAPVRRIVLPASAFKALIIKKYGTITPSVLEKVMRACRVLPGGMIETPVIRH